MDPQSAKAVTSKTRKLGLIVFNFETWNLEAKILNWRTISVGSSNMARQLCHLIISSRETTNEGSKQPYPKEKLQKWAVPKYRKRQSESEVSRTRNLVLKNLICYGKNSDPQQTW